MFISRLSKWIAIPNDDSGTIAHDKEEENKQTFKAKFLTCNVCILYYKNLLYRWRSSCSRQDVNKGVKFK